MMATKALKFLTRCILHLPGSAVLPNLLRMHPFKYPVRRFIFPIFHGGETLEDLKTTCSRINARGVSVIADYVTENETRGEYYQRKNLDNILTLIDSIDDGSGIVEPMISVKLTSIIHPQKLVQPETQPVWVIAKPLEQICEAARTRNISVLIDAEESEFRRTTDAVSLEMQREFNAPQGGKCLVYSTYQAYFTASPEILVRHIERAKNDGFTLGAKIVRGAYLEHELSHNAPVCRSIGETHRNYNRMTRLALTCANRVSLIAATHNRESVSIVQRAMVDLGIERDDPAVIFAQLHGVGDDLTEDIRNSGHRVAKYVPYGPYSETIPYLIRRLRENANVINRI